MDSYDILVIILSVLLGILLFIAVIVGIFLVKIIKDIRHITQKAAIASDSIEHAAQLFKSTTSLAAITKVVGNAVDLFAHKRSKKEK